MHAFMFHSEAHWATSLLFVRVVLVYSAACGMTSQLVLVDSTTSRVSPVSDFRRRPH